MSSTVANVLLGAVGTLLLSLIGGYVALRKLRPEIQSTEATTTRTIVEAGTAVIDRLVAEQARLGAEIARLRLELDALDTHVDVLESLMRDAGIPPPPRPPYGRNKE